MNKDLAYLYGVLSNSNKSSTDWTCTVKVKNNKKPLLKLFDTFRDHFKASFLDDGDYTICKVTDNCKMDLIDNTDLEFSTFYIQGMYESTYSKNSEVKVKCSESEAERIQVVSNTVGIYKDSCLTYSHSNALDFLYFVYSYGEGHSKFCYNKYKSLAGGLLDIKYSLNDESAVKPFKVRASDSGYDMTLVKLLKQQGNVYWYSTGVSLEPPNGYYFDMVPRSSLSKTGYIIANSVGIIDRSYTGDVIIVLIKIDQLAKDLVLPFRATQIIPRQISHMNLVNVNSLTSTNRNDSGFGSSSK